MVYFDNFLEKRMRLNELTSEVEFDGEPIDWDTFRQWFAVHVHDHPLSSSKFDEIVRYVAKQNAYNPIKDYLDSLDVDTDFNLDDVAPLFFGAAPGSLQATLTRKWLISAVARTYKPGCKADSTLILYEPRGGVGKSSFFRALCPDPSYFCDDMGDIGNKDERIKMHQHWIIEWGELDGIFGMKASSAVKSFLSCSTDNIRPPYGRTTQKMNRRSVICGTTNKRELLPEKGGQRRYWVVEVRGRINVEKAKALRDQIWGAAVKAYREGEEWWLTSEEERLNDKALNAHVSLRPYQEEVEDFLFDMNEKGVERFSFDKLRNEVDPGNNNPKFAKQVKAILEDLGWKSSRFRDGTGRLMRGYVKSEPEKAVTDSNPSKDEECSDLCYNSQDSGVIESSQPSG